MRDAGKLPLIEAELYGDTDLLKIGQTSLIVSIIAIIGGNVVKANAKLGGWVMRGSGAAIFITSCYYNYYGRIPAHIIVAGGLIGISRKTDLSHRPNVSL
ncbi:hypothetical protein MM221_14655 [Salipaludibacillus sp. LMS25]|uniref:hypothetical protein n=1 Tax=Salipaludibacillus sp. LMS25 TaxID=2924031 RepID=UPI0020CFEEDD|nr:hypothetical protein [Salipaludibacillus sp. LMS25]UTR13843.1 hypothetical protein MM221_14655 [Salipaludibacillus sp. LMS25]